MSYFTEPLDSRHYRENFSCGKDLLDNYFHRQAKQDVKRKLSACFVLVDTKCKKISGYYTLSSHSISHAKIPDFFKKKLPKSYFSIPIILLGRLAVHKDFQGKGIGKILLIESLKRSYDISESVGDFAVLLIQWIKRLRDFMKNMGLLY